jgi:3-oxoacyl-[acyl-carrier-protein] synthase-3
MFIQSRGIKIIGTGASIPDSIVSNKDIWPESEKWVSEVLGIDERRHLNPEEDLLDLCVSACSEALTHANISPQDLDAIIVATSTPDYVNPSMASIIHGKIQSSEKCASFDVQAVCAGFMYALGMVAALAAAKSGKYFLIVGADQFSRITDFQDRNCVFFGDAAAAMVLEYDEQVNSLLSVELFSQGLGWESFSTKHKPKYFVMKSKEVSEFASLKLPESVLSVCSKTGIDINEISHFCTHQPSKPLLDKLEQALMIDSDILNRNLLTRGNTAGATIPLLFHENKLIDKIKPSEIVAFSGIGAGWAWGSALLRWPS